MFFFFAGGLQQQVKQVLKSGASRCINCGANADLVDYETVLKLFFVPVWRWQGKDQLLHCPNCNLFFPHSFSLRTPKSSTMTPSLGDDALKCYSCACVVEPDHKFCPYCGVAL